MMIGNEQLSAHLQDDLQRLCLHAGYSATVSAESLTINKNENEPEVNNDTQDDEWVKYKGKVYCCTVPQGMGVLYIRRNGIPVWSGNSRHGQDNGP
jgi:hypothetical protein